MNAVHHTTTASRCRAGDSTYTRPPRQLQRLTLRPLRRGAKYHKSKNMRRGTPVVMPACSFNVAASDTREHHATVLATSKPDTQGARTIRKRQRHMRNWLRVSSLNIGSVCFGLEGLGSWLLVRGRSVSTPGSWRSCNSSSPPCFAVSHLSPWDLTFSLYLVPPGSWSCDPSSQLLNPLRLVRLTSVVHVESGPKLEQQCGTTNGLTRMSSTAAAFFTDLPDSIRTKAC